MTLSFIVRGQTITRAERTMLASDSRLYIAGKVAFDVEWSDITSKYLTFEPTDGTAIVVYLTDGSFDESAGVSLSAGRWQISAHGTNSAGKKIDTIPIEIVVDKAGGTEGEAPPYIPPSATDQIAAIAAEALETAREAYTAAAADADRAESAAESAEISANRSAQSSDSAVSAAARAAEFAGLAADSEANAAKSADRAESAATANGYAEFYIENGYLYVVRTSNIADKLDFRITNGSLEAIISG